MVTIPLLSLLLALFYLQVHSLRVAGATLWIEHTPLRYADNFYNADAITVVNGGISNLRDTSIDLAANAVTQGLKNYVQNRNFRLIGIIVEVTYRLVANKAAGIAQLTDLRGKRIGTIPGTSAEVFVRQLLASAGVTQGYTVVPGTYCMRQPCGFDTFPEQFRRRSIDAFGVWETSVELGIRALGANNVAVFKNATVYREVYSLYSTTEKLRDPRTRQKIVQYVKALNQTYDVFKNTPDKVYDWVGRTVQVDVPVLQSVWEDHVWGPGSLGKDLIDFIQHEDAYLATADRRRAFTREELETFVDPSVYEEAMRS